MKHHFQRSVDIARSPEDVFAWHERPGVLQRLTPPWEQVELESAGAGVRDGVRVVMKTKIGPVWARWEAEHYDYREGRQFCDRQVEGPFATWEHRHVFEANGEGGCRLTDDIRYELPLGAAGEMAAGKVEARLDRLFAYRHALTRADLELPAAAAGTIVISGASGLIGSALATFMRTQGWQVHALVRREVRGPEEISWSPDRGSVTWPEGFRCDTIVHLAGANLAGGRWTAARKEAILRSRIEGTRTLVGSLAQLVEPPESFLSGSAIGIYGDRGDEVLDEDSEAGTGFLANVCREWEAEADSAATQGVRTVKLRTSVVLDPRGGALAKLLPVFKAGVGGPVGSGQHWQSWITLDDWLRACRHIIHTPELEGPVNVAAPEAVRQAELATTLGRVLGRPAVLPTPAAAIKLALGEMADEALLASQRVSPRKLQTTGNAFLLPSLEKALRHVLGKRSGS